MCCIETQSCCHATVSYFLWICHVLCHIHSLEPSTMCWLIINSREFWNRSMDLCYWVVWVKIILAIRDISFLALRGDQCLGELFISFSLIIRELLGYFKNLMTPLLHLQKRESLIYRFARQFLMNLDFLRVFLQYYCFGLFFFLLVLCEGVGTNFFMHSQVYLCITFKQKDNWDLQMLGYIQNLAAILPTP